MRFVSRIFAAALISVVTIAAIPVGVLAGASTATYRPDARIRFVCDGVAEWRMCNPELVGNNIYNTTAKGQKRTWNDYFDYSTEPDPRVVMFAISIQNDGAVADRFKVTADGVTRGYRVRFLRGTTNITSAVEAGTYVTPRIDPGSAIVIKVKVVMPCDPSEDCGQDKASRLVTVISKGNPALADAVRFTRQRWVCYC